MGDWRLNIISSSGEQKVEKPTDDEDVVKILDRMNEKNKRGCLSCFCKKKYVLEEEVRTNRINEKKKKIGIVTANSVMVIQKKMITIKAKLVVKTGLYTHVCSYAYKIQS